MWYGSFKDGAREHLLLGGQLEVLRVGGALHLHAQRARALAQGVELDPPLLVRGAEDLELVNEDLHVARELVDLDPPLLRARHQELRSGRSDTPSPPRIGIPPNLRNLVGNRK